jgi:enoyl-CoA hydratase/carnithine racemase
LGVAREMLLTGRRLTADEALALGLVHRVVDGGALPAARAWADEIAALAPLTIQGHKRALNALQRHLQLRRDHPVEGGALAELDAAAAAVFRSDDLREGLAAFNEKRPPDFQGR